jgi:hypothetical protein
MKLGDSRLQRFAETQMGPCIGSIHPMGSTIGAPFGGGGTDPTLYLFSNILVAPLTRSKRAHISRNIN